MPDTSIVVIGGGLAAAKLAEAYREAGGEEVVTILSAEPELPYHRPPLSKAILRGESLPDDARVRPATYYEEQVIDVRLGARATAIDPVGREVVLDGEEHVPYGTLVVATGARPRMLPVRGADLIGVHTFRTMHDAVAVRDARDAHSTLVIGASFVGTEVAASLRTRGRYVTVVEPAGTIMPKLMCPMLSEQLAGLMREKGVDLMLGDEVTELRGNGRFLIGAHTTAGRDIEAFLAVVGIGVEPNSELLAHAGANVDDGVVVDERFQTSLEGVYAIGDVARFPEPVSGELRRIEHWSNAAAHGTHLGRMLAGSAAPFDDVPSFFTQIFDLKLQMLGDPRYVDDCALTGSVAEGRLLGIHLHEGRVVGAVLAGQAADVVAETTKLVRERTRVNDPKELVPDASRLRALALA
jgi:3-phenylpropionate/trans-cinnamate dioxygenase ferredoxin reductase subunit